MEGQPVGELAMFRKHVGASEYCGSRPRPSSGLMERTGREASVLAWKAKGTLSGIRFEPEALRHILESQVGGILPCPASAKEPEMACGSRPRLSSILQENP
jgi:hypothetical protein